MINNFLNTTSLILPHLMISLSATSFSKSTLNFQNLPNPSLFSPQLASQLSLSSIFEDNPYTQINAVGETKSSMLVNSSIILVSVFMVNIVLLVHYLYKKAHNYDASDDFNLSSARLSFPDTEYNPDKLT